MSKITLPPLPDCTAWTLTETLKRRVTTINGFLWFVNPVNCTWTELFTAEQMQERDRQVVEHVMRACAQAARNAPAHPNDATYCEAAVLALLPVKDQS